MGRDNGWEGVATAWADFVRSDADVLFETNFEQLLRMLPPPGRLTVDVGCGEGRVDRRLAALGHTVVGVDGSETLIRLAREMDPAGDYRVAPASDLPLDDGAGDLVVSFMALQDIEDLSGALSEAARVLEPEGILCFTIVHPVASGGDFQRRGDEHGFVVDAYFPERTRLLPLRHEEIEQYHRPLSVYLNAVASAGFALEEVRETPSERRAPGRVPMFLHVRAQRRDGVERRAAG